MVKDLDSFYFPLAEELVLLTKGMRTYDASKHEFFTLDMPETSHADFAISVQPMQMGTKAYLSTNNPFVPLHLQLRPSMIH
ncbi:hypothetical protein DACRYDRAFT_110144 [Dacryopinax primogenitus]|uniref:Uncharacterized protein n=1 Tax=Dacryopinax primogenitus (strain DJM 731) TaxID=1858805 RepID=M5G0R0_DACPD|nr:uncharacterized protein DACRYDRAFT_110144 [Dacryopinax primogenitus]EJT99421.1 hypothetical protein DACRYDRAFT_110144 [Dacryopinax primogenitus]